MEPAGAERHRREAERVATGRERIKRPTILASVRARCALDLTARMAVLLVANAPDGLVTVFADKQAAVFGDGDSDRATPDFALGRDYLQSQPVRGPTLYSRHAHSRERYFGDARQRRERRGNSGKFSLP